MGETERRSQRGSALAEGERKRNPWWKPNDDQKIDREISDQSDDLDRRMNDA